MNASGSNEAKSLKLDFGHLFFVVASRSTDRLKRTNNELYLRNSFPNQIFHGMAPHVR